MKKKFNRVYQFKITLKETKPPVWRRIRVPETYSFWDLHVAIQDAMGWQDCHLHLFEIADPSTGMKIEIGIPEEEYDEYGNTTPGWKLKIADYFSMENKSANYRYDFGDCWEHKIMLEKILPVEKDVDYPVCIEGKRACPPEDCGGTHGYLEFLEAIKDPKHPEHDEMLDWIGGEFDSEDFNPADVCFDDPEERRRMEFS